MKKALILFIFLAPLLVCAQELVNKDINKVDGQGRRQGYWKVYDVNGNIKFEGAFKNDLPTGTFKYYYEDGKIKAVSEMYENGKRSRTKVFHNNGRLMAEGNYLDRKKDSVWTYYSDYDGILMSREPYSDGELNGVVINYFPGGRIAEELPYRNGLKNGVWKRYFTDGKIKLKANYVDDKLEGLMLVYYQEGFPEVSGMYKDNYKDGMWLYYDKEGMLLKKERYVKGSLKEVIKPDAQ